MGSGASHQLPEQVVSGPSPWAGSWALRLRVRLAMLTLQTEGKCPSMVGRAVDWVGEVWSRVWLAATPSIAERR